MHQMHHYGAAYVTAAPVSIEEKEGVADGCHTLFALALFAYVAVPEINDERYSSGTQYPTREEWPECAGTLFDIPPVGYPDPERFMMLHEEFCQIAYYGIVHLFGRQEE